MVANHKKPEYRVESDTISDDPAMTMRTHVKRLRRKIRPRGIDVETIYGFGYALGDAERKRLRAIIAGVAS